MKSKTSELTGIALDWAVAGLENPALDERNVMIWFNDYERVRYSPSTDWTTGGPIIEHNKIEIAPFMDGNWYAATKLIRASHYYNGPTPLIAAMRCYVASKLGDEIEIPKELI